MAPKKRKKFSFLKGRLETEFRIPGYLVEEILFSFLKGRLETWRTYSASNTHAGFHSLKVG